MTEKALTTFKILELTEGADGAEVWKPAGFEQARDRDHALRTRFAASQDSNKKDTAGTFVAVSEAAWQPRTVKVTSTPKVEISAA
jgi:hypothetical protein